MRCTTSTSILILMVSAFAGCRTQTATMTNPFLAPDRVPPPATRTLMPGTAQPYYPGDPLPNTPVIGQPPGTFAPVGGQPPATFSPQPAGTVPPGGWNTSPQPIPNGSSSVDRWPTGIQPASANLPLGDPSVVQIQPDQQSLRFSDGAYLQQQSVQPPTSQPSLPPDPSILPTPNFPPAGQPAQPATFQATAPQQFNTPVAEPRSVRIRAISSDNLTADGQVRSSDGFRPQGSTQVRKPTAISRFAPQPVMQPTSQRFGHDANYTRLRGQLHFDQQTGSWSLQYASQVGSADSFGGQLAIANPQVLGGLQRGEYVTLQGRIDQSSGMPAYTAAVVQRQRI